VFTGEGTRINPYSGIFAMRRSAIFASAFALALTISGFGPAAAAPLVPAKAALAEAQDSIREDVRHRRHYRVHHGFYHRPHLRPRHGFSFGIVIGGPRYLDPWDYRPHYRFLRPRVYHRHGVRIGHSHMSWCYARYRSYDRWSNTFQPHHGRRKVCVSPYRY
jgi:hypothetical protein